MGGCAGKLRESNLSNDALPSEPVTPPPQKDEVEAVAQENKEGGEIQKEEPLVDLSEPKKEAEAEIVSVESHPEVPVAKPTEEAAVKQPSEDKVEAGKKETTEPVKEVQKVEVAPVAPAVAPFTPAVAPVAPAAAPAAVNVAKTAEIKTEKLPGTPKFEDKSDAPLVTV